jgi:hypothetical protein
MRTGKPRHTPIPAFLYHVVLFVEAVNKPVLSDLLTLLSMLLTHSNPSRGRAKVVS